ncbi:hypothetical protein M569_01579, partial [Genlisea aurea]
LTEYERRRLENIKRNEEMFAALKVRSRANDLADVATKRRRSGTLSYKLSPVKRVKAQSPIVLRRSLRTRGVKPDCGGLGDNFDEEKLVKDSRKSNSYTSSENSSQKCESIKMIDAYIGGIEGMERELVTKLKGHLEEDSDVGKFRPLSGSVDLDCLQLKEDHVARLLRGRIMSVKFFPTTSMQMVIVGNKSGDIAFWNVNSEIGDGISLYHPHSGPVGGITIDPFSISKVYTSCYDGCIRLMCVEKELFDMVYYTDYTVTTIALNPHNTNSLFFSEGKGGLNMMDMRRRKKMLSCDLHEARINTIDFHSERENLVATSSTDATACIWDLRKLGGDKATELRSIRHSRAVNSAYFSPGGKFLATTSYDDKVGVSSGANYEELSMIYHNNQTGRWISSFRGIWGWDDSWIFIGNMSRGIDAISVPEKKVISTLRSDHMTAIPCRFDSHPYDVGTLAGGTSGGQVYIWSRS